MDKHVLTKAERLTKLRYHWFSYVARGGFNAPRMTIGKLEKGGLNHWTLFLHLGRQYLRDFPKERHIVEGFVPQKLVKLLTGE